MLDAFEVLGLPVSFGVGPAQVQRAYMARAAAAHPDALSAWEAGGGEFDPEQEGAAEGTAEGAAARLNRAKETLLDDEQRAAVVLARLGGPAANEDRSLPPSLLADVMDKRSEFENAQGKGNAHAMEALRHWAHGQRQHRVETISGLFERAAAMPAGAVRVPVLKAIRTELNAWRYIERMLEQVSG